MRGRRGFLISLIVILGLALGWVVATQESIAASAGSVIGPAKTSLAEIFPAEELF